MNIPLFSHIGLTCDDPGRIERFYSRYFGFKRVKVFETESAPIIMLKAKNVYLELFKASEKSLVSPPVNTGPEYKGWRHICFSVDDLEQILKELGEDAAVTLGPLDLNELVPGMRACWISDPEGNIIELNEGYRD